MDTAQPLRVHIGPDLKKDLVLFNGLKVTRLLKFRAYCWAIDVIVITQMEVGGCFPELIDAPENGLSNEAYPLKIEFGHSGANTTIYYKTRPLGYLKGVDVDLEFGAAPVRKRTICIKAYEMDQDLIDELIKLKGVEIIIEPQKTIQES